MGIRSIRLGGIRVRVRVRGRGKVMGTRGTKAKVKAKVKVKVEVTAIMGIKHKLKVGDTGTTTTKLNVRMKDVVGVIMMIGERVWASSRRTRGRRLRARVRRVRE